MIPTFDDILRKQDLSLEEIKVLLAAEGAEKERLLRRGLAVKLQHLDNYVHLRGLIEFGNVCEKNCFYCGLRSGNERVERYCLSDEEVLDCARLAHELGYGSVALQSGERSDPAFIDRIERLVREIKKIDNGSLGITLSLGEQTEETYRRWFEAGAHRYLLRIESSNEELYYKIHPKNSLHDFRHRVECLEILKRTGYQTGTGVMVGLPFQTLDHLAADLLFFRQMDVAMVGLGPYIPHPDTPLYKFKDLIPSAAERMDLTLKMIAILRLLMPEINDARNQHGGGDSKPDGRSPGTGKGHLRRGQCHHAEPHARGIPRELFHLPGQGVRPRHARPVPVLPGHPAGGHRSQDPV